MKVYIVFWAEDPMGVFLSKEKASEYAREIPNEWGIHVPFSIEEWEVDDAPPIVKEVA